MNTPIIDLEELLDEVQDMIEEKIAIEGGNQPYIAFATDINGLQVEIAHNTKNYLRKTDKVRALKCLRRLSGFARSDTKKKTF